MTYSIQIKSSATKALGKISAKDKLRLIDAIDKLKEQPFSGTVLKGEYSGLRRIRVGNYRVVYEVTESALLVLVIRIGHRREVYR